MIFQRNFGTGAGSINCFGGSLDSIFIFQVKKSLFSENILLASSDSGGTGVTSFGCKYSVIDSIFQNNQAKEGAGVASGGAIQSNYNDEYSITNSVFRNNSAVNGGAILNWATPADVVVFL